MPLQSLPNKFALQGQTVKLIQSNKDMQLLAELTAAASTAQHIAFDFLIPNKLLRDPFQMNAATVAAVQKGNKFIQSIAFAIGTDVWIVAYREELLGAFNQILGSPTRKVGHFSSKSESRVALISASHTLGDSRDVGHSCILASSDYTRNCTISSCLRALI